MKYTYLSLYDFEKHCPCSYYLTAYAESLFPNSATVKFNKGSKSQAIAGRYLAEYDVILSSGQGYTLEVSCTRQPDQSFTYETLKKTEHP